MIEMRKRRTARRRAVRLWGKGGGGGGGWGAARGERGALGFGGCGAAWLLGWGGGGVGVGGIPPLHPLPTTHTPIHTPSTPIPAQVNALVWSANGERLISADENGKVRRAEFMVFAILG